MSCPLARDDAAYVLGALSPGDRLAFERHLPGCLRCSGAVQELAGLPGLLDRVQPGVLSQPGTDQPVPSTLLPALVQAVRRARRRLAVTAAAGAAVATGVVVPVVLSQLEDGSGAAPVAGDPGTSVVSHSMAPVGDVPVQARLALEQVLWGTRLDLACTYDPSTVTARLPAGMDYVLYVRARDGHAEQVGSWHSVAGRTMRLSAATAVRRADIASVEVRAPDGSVLLTLPG